MNIHYNDLIKFHGHSCPGLAIGFRMTSVALSFFPEKRSEDEELVAIVENDACGVDALQVISGCTFGKGNLIFKDYGKHVFTLYDRKSKKGVRVVFKFGKVPEDLRQDRDRLIDWLLNVDEKEIIQSKEVVIDAPAPARIFKSVTCEFCGEEAMETRARKIDGKTACIPCVEKHQQA
jgi:formylmethanofuran dehydrogenase subunit E